MYSLFLAEIQTEPNIVHIVESLTEKLYEANIFNFIIVLMLLCWISKKINILSGIDAKINTIKQRITNAEENKKISNREMELIKKNTDDVYIELTKIESDAAEIASGLSRSVLEEAHMEAVQIEKKSEKIIESEKEAATLSLSNNLTKAAFDIAEEHIKQSIDDRLQKKYINEFIENLDKVKV